MRPWLAINVVLMVAACAASETEPEETTTSSLAMSTSTITDPAAGVSDVLALAEDFIDAFYSWDPDAIGSLPWSEDAYLGRITYYQGWAEAGNYQIIERHPCQTTDVGARCAVKVSDDLLPALGLEFHATDTFHLRIKAGEITAVETSSDDPEIVQTALEWLGETQPELLEGPCLGFFDGGPTPDECVRAAVEGFKTFAATQGSSP